MSHQNSTRTQGLMPPLPAAAETALASNDELLLLIAQGDQRAFATLYDRTASRVLGIVSQCLRDPAQSEEVTQEVFLELWQNAARFDASRGKALSWMLTTARRRAIDRVRSSQASRDRDLAVGIRELPTPYDQVAESIHIQFQTAEVLEAMTRITALQREAIQLAYFGSMTMAEIADQLGVSISTVKTRLRDGLIALRRHMLPDVA
ncbi:RNA polymerase sigma factor SigK [Frondihabitans sucicola]|uniref:RNA polymerase sigma factor SigK n=1 Tax=Frondihabitans sucicola TaxID=1268041 RepID=A0ABN6XWX2_9MICO|nr:ECF RNA polymerase sigma factor SigK [Frondihabitans sucicola]BDZ48648.1 RNA polymerase sigma factor SigK [Frondihabitans sucicola]